jgi:peptidyl-tRNA hydrolase
MSACGTARQPMTMYAAMSVPKIEQMRDLKERYLFTNITRGFGGTHSFPNISRAFVKPYSFMNTSGDLMRPICSRR